MIVLDFPLTMLPERVHPPRRWKQTTSLLSSLLFRLRSSRFMRLWGYGAFVFLSLLSTSFYPVAEPALERMDPCLFVAIQMAWLVPPALFLLTWSRWRVGRSVLLRGVILGSCMGTALFCLTLAAASTSITETALFSCMNGVVVVLVSWLVFRQRFPLLTWLACVCSVAGIGVLLCASRMHWQGDLLAGLGGLLLTGYSFLIERFRMRSHPSPQGSLRALCGVQWLTMAAEASILALLFGNWHIMHLLPSDILMFSYVSLATTLLPMVIMLLLRRYVNGVTVTFITIIEPILDACFAFFFVHEHFLPLVYFGGLLALGSVLLQALASCIGSASSSSRRTRHGWSVWSRLRKNRPVQKGVACQPSWPLGKRSCALLAQLWFEPQGRDLSTLHRLTGIPYGSAHRVLASLHTKGYVGVSHATDGALCYTLHPSWRGSPPLQEERPRKRERVSGMPLSGVCTKDR